jgi:hypothetical protein
MMRCSSRKRSMSSLRFSLPLSLAITSGIAASVFAASA